MEYKVGDHVLYFDMVFIITDIENNFGILRFKIKKCDNKYKGSLVYWTLERNIKLAIAYYRDLKLKELGI